MAIEGGHEAVMTAEVVEFLGGRRTVVDMTVGSGGHAAALLEAGVSRLVGVDRDPEALALAGRSLSAFGERVQLVAARFSEVDEDVVGGPADGVLFDLGVSSMQLDRPERGFGYRVDGPLDMRMGEGSGEAGPSAADLVNGLPERDLADLIYRLGEEPRSRRIAAAIVRHRPVRTTDQLTGIVVSAVGKRPGGPHPARRTFQALRIAVNRELEELTAALPPAAGLLGPGGRVVVISYHSLEDRIVKRAFRDDDRLDVLTKKPLVASAAELAGNPRSRSAKLRAAERSSREAA
ncbi:MAG TPA: 16S rRNA (cytosine(1402)-N(4))-methyltransferase RsmH [Actinomycetota bacterium]|nr:16S rRNA (cytosine(1402)-N(4))-methyltransferase RsmH [Actinomycetota bacterium]